MPEKSTPARRGGTKWGEPAARARWGEPRHVRLTELSPITRQLVVALVAADRAAKKAAAPSDPDSE